MNKAEFNQEIVKAKSKYTLDLSSNVRHQMDYFQYGFRDGVAGYYDTWYDDKKAANAYRQGNFAGRELFTGEFQLIGS